jgi:outer membrane protein
MKHTWMAALAGAVLLAGSPAEAQQATQGQIVFINSQQVVAAAPGAREAQSTLEREMGALRTEVQGMETTLDSMMTSYEQRQVMLSPEARRQLQDEIRTRQREFQQRAQQMEQQAGARQAELLQPIMARVQQVIDALRAERGYALVLDAAEGGLISADPALDITQEVLTRLRATAPAQ